MTNDPGCPRCQATFADAHELFVNRDGGDMSQTVKCRKCGTLFTIDQVPSVDYDTRDACGNHGCEHNSFKTFSQPKNGYVSETCLSSIFRCKDYLPTEAMVKAWERDNQETYEEVKRDT
jgi:hypothetical protein